MTKYYAHDYIHEDGRPSNRLCEKYVYLADDVDAAIPSRDHIQRLKTLARIIRRFAACGDPAPVLDSDADAVEAALSVFDRFMPHA